MEKLRKNITITLAGLIVSIILSSSSIAQMDIAFGPKVGLAVNSFRGAGAGKVEAETNWVHGLFFNLEPVTFITIQPEMILNHKRDVQTMNDIRNKIDIVYLEFPALAKFKISINNIYFPHLLIGSNIACNIHSNISSTDTQTGKVNENSPNIKRLDIGGIVGVGIDIKKEWAFFTLDVRYGLGFNNIGKNSNNLNIKNTGWSIAFGVGERFSNK